MTTKKKTISTKTASTMTESLVRTTLPIDSLRANPNNPNEMSDKQFNLLYDNIERVGLTDPILVRPTQEDGVYEIVGGEHRWEVAKLHELAEVPVTIITDADFDDDMMAFQTVRHNIIHGSMSPKKFMAMYQKLSGKYSTEVAAEMFGFAEEEEFRKLVIATAKSLPDDMKESFTKAAKEVKTITGLASLLNKLFTDFGDTLPYGFMVFDYGNHDNIWLRMNGSSQKKEFLAVAEEYAVKGHRSMDAVVTLIFKLLARKEFTMELFNSEVDKLPVVLEPTENAMHGSYHSLL